jgi:hypothetical protein
MSISLNIGKNLSIFICASKGESIKTIDQGFKTKEEM